MRHPDSIKREIRKVEERLKARIDAGRTRGAGAGGFNRDIENISHRLRLLRDELAGVEGRAIRTWGEAGV